MEWIEEPSDEELAEIDRMDMMQAHHLIGEWLAGKPVNYDEMAYIGMLLLSIARRNGTELPE
ncbi:hypothetical protein Tsedi_02397 [Tepidimonas sediminis]|uniref:Uncharacterized protein n=1 Tax=Tepidimonas sediminis TaxID=2588941 RepID=A0A554WF84_9BURK|nr:hypothetical protein [Tepidimonas sediminis]TSE22236.1 hypothetical protein Tsedi_02397 [Tepidimonas sediminis]